MGKEKKRKEDGDKKELTFYYEIVGIITILISIITLARLGNSGKWLMIFFKLLFGDWYFVTLFLLLVYGFRSLLFHQPMEVKTMRFMGIVIFLIGLLTISHFPMHNYVSNIGGNHIQMTISMYGHYLKYYNDQAVLGGGIIGGSFFYLFYLLFGAVGAVIIACFLLVVGIAFMLKKTLKEFSIDLFNIAKGGFQKSKNLISTLKYGITQDPKLKNKKKSKRNRIRLPLKLLNDVKENKEANFEENNASNIKRTICAILNNMGIFYREVRFIISYHITTFIIDTKMFIDHNILSNKLKEVLEKQFSLKIDSISGQVTIELNNTYPQKIYLKKSLLGQTNLFNNYLLPLGFNYKKEIVESNLLANSSLLIIGDKDSNIINYLKAITLSIFFKNLPESFNLTIIDLKKLLVDLKEVDEYHTEISEVILTLKNETEEILEKLSSMGVNNIEEYNRLPQITEPLEYHVILLVGLENIINESQTIEEIIYLLHTGKKCGIMMIVAVMEDIKLSTRLNSLFDDKVILWNEFKLATEILGSDSAANLEKENDAIYKRKIEIARIATTKIDINEIKNILKEI